MWTMRQGHAGDQSWGGAQPDPQCDQWPLSIDFSMCLILVECFLLLEFPICPGFPRKYCSRASMELVLI